FNASYSDPSSLDATSIRVDHLLTSKFNLFGRYNYSPSDLIQRGPFVSVGNVLSQTSALSSTVHTATAGVTQLITPTISNETRLNYSKQTVGVRQQLDDFGGGVPLPDTALFPSGFTSENSSFGFYIAGAGQWNYGRPQNNEQRQFNLVDNLSATIRAHQMKFGVDYRRL